MDKNYISFGGRSISRFYLGQDKDVLYMKFGLLVSEPFTSMDIHWKVSDVLKELNTGITVEAELGSCIEDIMSSDKTIFDCMI